MIKQEAHIKLRWLTIGVSIMAFAASVAGITWAGLYHDEPAIVTAWYANDIITLFIVVPVILACLPSPDSNKRQQLIWLGSMLYMLYNYCFYLFGAVFNKLFLLYAMLVAMALYALIIAFVSLVPAGIERRAPNSKLYYAVAIFLLAVATPLAGIEIFQCIRYISHDILPQVPKLVLALDLTLVVPNMALAAVLLWQKKAWGDILTSMMLIKASGYGLVLVSGSILIAVRQAGPLDPLLPYYLFVAIGGLVFSWMFFQAIKV